MKVAEKEGDEEGCGGRREPNGSIGGDSTLASRGGARVSTASSGGRSALSRAIRKFIHSGARLVYVSNKPFVRVVVVRVIKTTTGLHLRERRRRAPDGARRGCFRASIFTHGPNATRGFVAMTPRAWGTRRAKASAHNGSVPSGVRSLGPARSESDRWSCRQVSSPVHDTGTLRVNHRRWAGRCKRRATRRAL